MQLLKRLLYILPASNQRLAQVILLFIFSSSLEVLGIGIVGPFIALATNPELIYDNQNFNSAYRISNISSETTFIAVLGIVLILVFFLKSFVAWFTQSYIARFSDEQQRLLINKIIRGYLDAPYIYHTQKNSSAIIDTTVEVANNLTTGILNPIFVAIANFFVVVSLFILLFNTSQIAMIAILTIFLPFFIIFNSFKSKVQRWGKEMRKSKENIIKIVNHAFGGVKETKVIGCENYFESRVVHQTQNLKVSHSSFVAFKIMPRFLFEALMILCVIGMVVAFLLAGKNTQELIPVLGIYGLASIRLIPAVSNTISGITVLKNSSFTIRQIYAELQDIERLTTSVKSDRAIAVHSVSPLPIKITNADKGCLNFEHSIVLDALSYQYPGSTKYSIDHISLSINKGESIGFIGQSGAGKTTLVDIILGLLTPQQGDILVDGISIYTNLKDWQRLIGYIPQSIFLMDDTLEKNIAFGVEDEQIDEKKLWQAIEMAQLSDVVQGLPNGVRTNVGERGILLSGGQRQRVGIARALYHDSEILVLDEATAALDNETEKLVTDSIMLLTGNKTIITIAHRLSTVEHCDRIYLLDSGKVAKCGKFEEVVLR